MVGLGWRIVHPVRVLSEPEARRVAEETLGEELATGRVAITKVDERDIGWAYFYQSSRYITSGTIADALGGNAPILVRRDGKVLPTGTGRPLEFYIEQHERREAWEEGASETQRVLTMAIEELSVIGPGMRRTTRMVNH